ncbi:MAG: phosphate starvation-inducible protein PhoH [Clostridiales bacterium]|nr:phosphate starvation-inducible protein PhoH [Clostridiales bacterium]
MPLDTFDSCVALFGLNDRNIRTLEEELVVNVYLRDGELQIIGENENIKTAEQVIAEMLRIIELGEHLDAGKIRYLIQMARQGTLAQARDSAGEVVAYTYKGQKIKCKTPGQSSYVQAIRNHGLTLSVGPAGTGKTYLAVAMAAVALRNKEVERLILTRPAVEAGEKLGFLPGDMAQKVDPYLRPLYDALFEILGLEAYQRYMERGAIEVAPLAFMRGRTLNDAFIILDEAQNATPEQMKMFLTRMGRNARVVVNGDPSQIDLPYAKRSGLLVALDVLKDVEGIQIVRLNRDDVVRNDLVQRIVNAYENYEAAKEENV